MYIPRHAHFFLPVLTILLGFYVRHRFGGGFDTMVVFLFLCVLAVGHTYYIIVAGILYQKYATFENQPEKTELEWREQAQRELAEKHDLEVLGKLPPIKTYGKAMELPRFDKERNLAITLLRMQEQGYKVDLTEDKWVKTGKYIRSEFKALLGLWEEYGIVVRKDARTNAPYVVNDWNKLRLVADGNPLPHRE